MPSRYAKRKQVRHRCRRDRAATIAPALRGTLHGAQTEVLGFGVRGAARDSPPVRLQGIHDPALKLVVVHTAVGKDASGDASGTHLGAERDALLRGIVARYGNW